MMVNLQQLKLILGGDMVRNMDRHFANQAIERAKNWEKLAKECLASCNFRVAMDAAKQARENRRHAAELLGK